MTEYAWRKSSFSQANDGNCIELARGAGGAIVLRESDDPSVIVTSDRAKLSAFIAGVKAGEFDDLI
ncbi:DUF397 domain-containing protein [Kitasatospora mediocidica]|uniref:DUF397 domain-containing protein n=1 Tax=Kitasatospora mediocidica TaxID=58352 RepID=UPI000A054825|nr:DUF397 domain-containing protein [Kitasatospora mediocidica]